MSKLTTEHVAKVREAASARSDIRMPIETEKGWFSAVDDDVLLDLAGLCRRPFAEKETSDLRVEVFGRFVRLLGPLGLAPATGEDNTSSWRWAGIRCILAGAGYEAHRPLATAILSLYAEAPFDPEQPFEDWKKELFEAHTMSGVPCVLGLLPYAQVKAICDRIDTLDDKRWLRVVAVLHLLKHVRLDTSGDDAAVRVCCNGAAQLYQLTGDDTDPLAHPKVSSLVLSRLGGSSKVKKGANHLDAALHHALSRLSLRNLLQVQPLTSLPPAVLWGPWSGVEPAAPDPFSFTQCHMRLTGVWVAEDGNIRPERGDEEVLMPFAWLLAPERAEISAARGHFAAGLPEHYSVDALPADLLRRVFPNMAFDWTQVPEAHLALYDAAIASGVLRYHRQGMEREYLMIWTLPSTPTRAGSTNNGKTTCATAIAHAICPGLEPSGTKDTDAATDSRAISSVLRQWGTIFLDDWHPVRSKSHILHRDTLQRLCTGGTSIEGMVYENTAPPVRLRHNIIVTAKCADLPPDLVNRSLFLWLDALPDEARALTGRADAAVSGQLGLMLRLAADHWICKLKIADAPAIGHPSWRFPHFLAAACAFLRARVGGTEAEALALISRALDEQTHHHEKHQEQAEESGLAAEADGRRALHFNLRDLFHDIGAVECEGLSAVISALHADAAMTPGQLLRARGIACFGEQGCPRSLGGILKALGLVSDGDSKDRTVSVAVSDALRRAMPEVGKRWTILESPRCTWALHRLADGASGVFRCSLHATKR